MSGPGKMENRLFVHVHYQGHEYRLSTFPNEYRSLMMLIYDRIVTEDFGDCLGMGKCGTCQVEIIGQSHAPTCYERNGAVNLVKAGRIADNVQLACQILIDEKIDGLQVNLINKIYI